MPVAIVTLDEDISELEDLARSAGYDVRYELIQRRKHPNTKTFLGKGKVEELKELVEAVPISAIIFNGELKPSQHYLLENLLGVERIDRVLIS